MKKLARLPNAPTAVVQDPEHFGFPIVQNPANVHVSLAVDHDGRMVPGPGALEAQILEGAGTWNCGGHDDASRDRVAAARLVAGAWVAGRTEPPSGYWDAMVSLIDTAWSALRSLPADEQLARVAALRGAALKCQENLYDILTAPALR